MGCRGSNLGEVPYLYSGSNSIFSKRNQENVLINKILLFVAVGKMQNCFMRMADFVFFSF